MSKFRNIGLVARFGSESIVESLGNLESYLASREVQVILERNTAAMMSNSAVPVVKLEEMGTRCDLVVVVGGDGAILGAARTLAPFGVPILGVNRGRLGFLADVSPDDIDTKVGAVLAGDYTLEEHFLLEGEVLHHGEKVGDACALNDVVVHPDELPRMIEFDLFIDKHFVYRQYSDGLIIATPTGSTAYALSAGGPIMHPNLNAVVLVPMFPHTLNSRPIVVSGESEIRIVVCAESSCAAQISFDSQIEIAAEQGDEVIVRKQKHKLRLIHPPGHSFYQVCRNKLDWASRLGE